MKPEAAKFAEHASIMLARAEVMLTAGLNEDAARMAYMASFHVAQAYIFERTDKSTKTHRGVQTEFLRLTKDDPLVDAELRKFLSQSYEFKTVADYATGDEGVTSAQEATDAVAQANRFVVHIASLTPIRGDS